MWSGGLVTQLTGQKYAFMPKLSAMIFAALTPKEFDFRYVDEDIEDVDFDYMNVDLVAITAMTMQAKRAYQIADRYMAAGKTVVIGGIHATVMSDEVAEHCDALMVGVGENTWKAMLDDFSGGTLKKVYNAKDYPPVTKLISPRIDIIRHDSYLLYPIQATRGCPNHCDFCSIRSSSGIGYIMKPVDQVVAEIKALEKYNKGHLGSVMKKGYQFVDDNLYVNRQYTKELFAAMKDLRITWSGQGTINVTEDDETLRLLAESGCRSFSIGFESVSDASLRESNKPSYNKTGNYKQAVERLIRYGITPSGYFVFGFDSDPKSVFDDTVKFARESHLIQTHFSVLTPYPGTTLWDRLNDEGRIISRDWSRYNSLLCVFSPKNFMPEEINQGAYRSAVKTVQLSYYREQLKHFWDHGPWRSNPVLTLKERLTLFVLAYMLRKQKEYKNFLLWVASKRKAVSISTVVLALSMHDMAVRAELNDTVQISESHIK
jgi:radical SAM superfamily enzyme YgiQ (UPF0313 family)